MLVSDIGEDQLAGEVEIFLAIKVPKI
jgi:hypothetical protein